MSSSRARNAGRKMPSRARAGTGTRARRKTKRRRGAVDVDVTAPLPHRDLDTPVAGLRPVVGSLDEQIGLAVRRHFDGGQRETRRGENVPDAVRALETER